MKKLIFLIASVAIGFFSVLAQDTVTHTLNIELAAGDVESFNFTDEPILSVNNGNLEITLSGGTLCFPLKDVKNISLDLNGTTTGVAELSSASRAVFSLNETYISVQNADAVKAYMPDGRFVLSEKASSGEIIIERASMPKGVIILETINPSSTFKFINL